MVTDSIRDIILETVSEINEVMKSMGDLIISGGEAYNMYVPYEDRVVTTDIDAKFVPRMTDEFQVLWKTSSTSNLYCGINLGANCTKSRTSI